MTTPALGIAAPTSESGKTLVTMGILKHLQQAGREPVSFKVGPDFIDPLHHRAITGQTARTLDRTFQTPGELRACFHDSTASAEVAVVEGVMGLYDGKGIEGTHSTADVFATLGIPYLLVLDASRQSHSVAALVEGFRDHDDRLDLAGVVLNQVASPRHRRMLTGALNQIGVDVLASIPRDDSLDLPSRHLGLHTGTPPDAVRQTASEVASNLTNMLQAARPATSRKQPGTTTSRSSRSSQSSLRLGIARDAAFQFYYPANLEFLRRREVELIEVSPLNDSTLPGELDGLYLGGGYPEAHAGQLAANHSFKSDLRTRLRDGLPLLAECGGLLYCGQSLQQASGDRNDMLGLFPVESSLRDQPQALGYVRGSIRQPGVFGDPDQPIVGHEFHYADVELNHADDTNLVVELAEGSGILNGRDGIQIHNAVGLFTHLYFPACQSTMESFLETCRSYRREPNRVEATV